MRERLSQVKSPYSITYTRIGIATDIMENVKHEVWYVDSGASKYMTNNSESLFDLAPPNKYLVIENDEKSICKAKGKLKINVQISKTKEI